LFQHVAAATSFACRRSTTRRARRFDPPGGRRSRRGPVRRHEPPAAGRSRRSRRARRLEKLEAGRNPAQARRAQREPTDAVRVGLTEPRCAPRESFRGLLRRAAVERPRMAVPQRFAQLEFVRRHSSGIIGREWAQESVSCPNPAETLRIPPNARSRGNPRNVPQARMVSSKAKAGRLRSTPPYKQEVLSCSRLCPWAPGVGERPLSGSARQLCASERHSQAVSSGFRR
jgi:hypothetical protein